MAEDRSGTGLFKFVCYSLFGLFMFFYPLSLWGKTTIPVDHIISYITRELSSGAKLYILLVMYVGAVLPFIRGHWNKGGITLFFTIAKVCGAVAGTVLYFGMAPEWLARLDFGPFLYDKLATPVWKVLWLQEIWLTIQIK